MRQSFIELNIDKQFTIKNYWFLFLSHLAKSEMLILNYQSSIFWNKNLIELSIDKRIIITLVKCLRQFKNCCIFFYSFSHSEKSIISSFQCPILWNKNFMELNLDHRNVEKAEYLRQLKNEIFFIQPLWKANFKPPVKVQFSETNIGTILACDLHTKCDLQKCTTLIFIIRK